VDECKPLEQVEQVHQVTADVSRAMADMNANVNALRSVLMDSARHVITRILNPRFLSHMAFYDLASTVHQSLP